MPLTIEATHSFVSKLPSSTISTTTMIQDRILLSLRAPPPRDVVKSPMIRIMNPRIMASHAH